MAELSVSKKAIEAALAVDNAASTAEAAVDTRRLAALQFFAPAEKIGGSYDAKNNLWVSVRNWAYDVCATVVCGEAGLKFLRDETTTGKAEMAVTHGKLKGQTRDKKYLQQQVGKLIGLIKADLKKLDDTANGNGKDAVERQDCDRFLDAIAKAHKQVSKAKPDGSIPQGYADAFAEMFAKLK